DRSVSAGDQQLFLAVRVQEHEVGARLHRDRLREVGVVALVDLVAGAQGADVDDVVIVLDRLVRRDMGNSDVDLVREQRLLLLGRWRGDSQGSSESKSGEIGARLHGGFLEGGGRTAVVYPRNRW